MYSRLRFMTAAILIASGTMIAAGVPALLFLAAERTPVAIQAQSNMPKIAANGASNVAPVEIASAAGPALAQPLTETRPAAPVPHASVPQAAAPQAAMPQGSPPQASAPQTAAAPAAPLQQSVPQEPVKRSAVVAPVDETPARPAARERPVAKPAIKAQTQPSAEKKSARRERIAKKPSTEALNAVRRFGDNLRDIPVSSYAADGTRRTIVIRPTSIQDVYYYSR